MEKRKSTNNHRLTSARARKCECCGRIVVYLRKPGLPAGEIRYVVCYAKTWDGNPWYSGQAHAKHPPKRFFEWKEEQRVQKAGGDPFFVLD